MGFKNILLLTASLIALASCSKNSSEPNPENTIEEPTAAKLIFPENYKECNEGEVLDEFQSSVFFRWNASENADSYEVNVQTLDTKTVSKIDVKTNEAKIIIKRGTAYKWFVISKSSESGTTAQSETWQFYNAGEGSVNHAPFPANAVSPKPGSEINQVSGKIDLKWETTDIDGDIARYKLFFGTDNPPVGEIGTITDKKISVEVISGNTYFWSVETVDNSNNVSQSDVFNFRVK